MDLESSTSELDSPKVEKVQVKPPKVKSSHKSSSSSKGGSSSSKPEVVEPKDSDEGFLNDIIKKLYLMIYEAIQQLRKK